MIVAIHAYENLYSGLHGMESHLVVEVADTAEAYAIAVEESKDIIGTYSEIIETFMTAAECDGYEEGSDEYDAYIEEEINGDVNYTVFEVIDPYASIEEMNKDFYNDAEEFIKQHCRELV